MLLILYLTSGLLVGVLINYLADVLPVTHDFSRPSCIECKQPFTFKNYFFSSTCSNCGHKKSPRTIGVLLSAIVLCGLLYYFPFHTLNFWATLPILAYLGLVVVIDIEHRLVLGETTLFGIVMFLIYGILLNSLKLTLLGLLAGFLIMLVFFLLGLAFSAVVGKLRRREISEVAFGFGDVTTGAILGLLTGWPAIVGAITLGFVSFAFYSIILLLVLILTKRYRAFTNALPFTPFLILGTLVIYYL